MAEYVITVEADRPPEVLLGQKLLGGKVTGLNLGERKLISAAELAKKYGLSTATVRSKLAVINQGTIGKHLYDPEQADALLTMRQKGSRRRKN